MNENLIKQLRLLLPIEAPSSEIMAVAADEIERYQLALEKIATYNPVDDSAYFDVRDIARKAIGHE